MIDFTFAWIDPPADGLVWGGPPDGTIIEPFPIFIDDLGRTDFVDDQGQQNFFDDRFLRGTA